MEQKQNRSSFSGKLGFVLSAAGASVGLGNIWRFPVPGAKIWRGIFLLIYILLAVTFGYTMIMAETALGRMTRKVRLGLCSFWKGTLACIWRMDQRGNSHFDCAVLFGYWRLGYQVFGGVYYRSWQ